MEKEEFEKGFISHLKSLGIDDETAKTVCSSYMEQLYEPEVDDDPEYAANEQLSYLGD